MIEIDRRYHLVKEQAGGRRFSEANVEKWVRDRDFDRFMLCNGVPVLRVWYTDVDKRPQEILTQVMQIFESLGGSGFSYR